MIFDRISKLIRGLTCNKPPLNYVIFALAADDEFRLCPSTLTKKEEILARPVLLNVKVVFPTSRRVESIQILSKTFCMLVLFMFSFVCWPWFMLYGFPFC
jgi:hypothetical protein